MFNAGMQITRRSFVFASLATPFAFRTVTNLRRSEPWKNEKFLVAKVGCGGMGGSDLGEVAKHKSVEIVSLCDIDRRQLDTLTKGGK
ncbi:MAG: hypothetical protein EBU31_10935, partial [Proteobacteria bacterium]|nr:hypothetical protein [Pseudomonadota bacterium]